ncbi:MAG: hypothetical protein A3H70_00655 [Candidatus Komeilibacteria bacterium RIFCSPLOWO2_02_FULL_48_11]|uniref:Uncharacterized protein n=1 Tax=Candidatus Komeilibacteria bacterium RIFCSPLOWO2_02_FULL_48_11 TaxID=1798553 RepID=A0A1G2BTT1_9BACT|nr:MAG: hypothetical protein A3H70_00655 [Candidatus Komeilibacteria bacterium RIFCSPLOWO2_02_FULL_48_11]
MPQTKEYISVKELRPFIIQTVSEVLEDPDFGLELSDRAKMRLQQARDSSEKGIPFSEIKRKYC